MLSRIARNFIRLNLSLLVVLFFIALNIFVVLSNYVACKISFELLGTENRPLGTDEIVGVFFRTVFSQASLAHLYALLVAVTVSLGLFVLVKLSFDSMKLLDDRKVYMNNGDEVSAQIARQRIIRNLIMIGIFALPLGFAIYWDIHLFRFRSIAQVLGYEYPEMVVGMAKWSEQLSQKGHLWVWFLIKVGAWGYLAITAICCLILEFAIYRTGEHWALLVDALNELFQPPQRQEIPLQSPSNRQEVHQQDIPVGQGPRQAPEAAQDSDYPEYGVSSENPGCVSAFQAERAEAEVPTPCKVRSGGNGKGEDLTATKFKEAGGNNGAPRPERMSGGLFEPTPPPPVEPARPQPPGPKEFGNPLKTIIGSPHGERISVTEALANQDKYWVDPDNQEVWDATYRESLMGCS